MAEWIKARQLLEHPDIYGDIQNMTINYHIDGGTVRVPTYLTSRSEQKITVRENNEREWVIRLFQGGMYLVSSKPSERIFFTPAGMSPAKMKKIISLLSKPYGNAGLEAEAMETTLPMLEEGMYFPSLDMSDVQKVCYLCDKFSREEVLEDTTSWASILFFPVVLLSEETELYYSETMTERILIRKTQKKPKGLIEELDEIIRNEKNRMTDILYDLKSLQSDHVDLLNKVDSLLKRYNHNQF